MVYTLLPLPSKREIRNMIKSIKITNVKDIKNDLLKPNDFMLKRKIFIRKRISKNLVKEIVLIMENMVTLVKTAKNGLYVYGCHCLYHQP